jgi:hypothetical protein
VYTTVFARSSRRDYPTPKTEVELGSMSKSRERIDLGGAYRLKLTQDRYQSEQRLHNAARAMLECRAVQ